MSRLLEHAERELRILEGDAYEDSWGAKQLLEIVEVFANQGHSGGSAHEIITLLPRLLSFQPLTPLTGHPSEWGAPVANGDNGVMVQNLRFSRVIKYVYPDGHVAIKDVEAIVFKRGEDYFTNQNSAKDITFPYMPKREVVEVREEGNG